MNIKTQRKLLVYAQPDSGLWVRHGYMDYNPLRDAERPRGQGTVEQTLIRILSPDEVNALLDGVQDAKYNMLFRLAIMSGARQGVVRAQVKKLDAQDRSRSFDHDRSEALAVAVSGL